MGQGQNLPRLPRLPLVRTAVVADPAFPLTGGLFSLLGGGDLPAVRSRPLSINHQALGDAAL